MSEPSKVPIRVLIVEDSIPDAELLVYELRQGGYEPGYKVVDTSGEMSEALDKSFDEKWDIVLADYMMPQFNGLAALDLLKDKGLDIPFIIVSGLIGEETAVQAMKAGASDYIMKGNLARLVPAVERELREAEVRRERRKAEQERDRLMVQLRTVNEQLVLRSLQIQEQGTEIEEVIAAMAEAVVVYGPSGEIIQLNPAAADLLGYSSTAPKKPLQEQLAGLRMETTDGRPFPAEECPPARALHGETVRGVIAIIHRPSDAKPVWVSISAAPIQRGDGKCRGGVTIFTDITSLQERLGTTGPKA